MQPRACLDWLPTDAPARCVLKNRDSLQVLKNHDSCLLCFEES
jgi:hypothetical protein